MPSRHPLSPSQQRIWLAELRHPGSPVNHIVGCYRVDGPVDSRLLADAVRLVGDRHELLRAGFVEREDTPEFEIHERGEAAVETMHADSYQDAYASAVAAAQRPFELSRPGLLRLHLCRFGNRRQLLTIVVHHLVADGTAASVVTSEVAAAYTALAAGLDWSPPAVITSYSDYLAEERRRTGGGPWRAGLAYWREELAGAPEALDLPTDFRRPASRSARSHPYATTLSGTELAALRRFARAHRASPTIALAAGWAATLHRLSGQSELVVGVPVARRERPEHAGLVGPLLNVVPVRLGLALDGTLPALVRRVRQKLLAGLAHQHIPFQAMVDTVAPPRVAGTAPVVQVLFTHDAAGPGPRLDGARAVPVALDLPAGMDLDLQLSVVDAADRAQTRLSVQGAADLFEAVTVRGILDQLLALVRDGLARPDVSVAELELAGPRERAAVAGWCTGPAAATTTTGVLERFQCRAQRHPDAVAIVSGDRETSYRLLDRRSDAVAGRLAAAGVRPGDIVAVHLPRGVELVVGLLAAWKVGAGYLPVDPDYPRRRVEFLLRDSRAAAVLTSDPVAQSRSPLPGRVLAITDLAERAGAEDRPPAPPRAAAGRDDLAYVIYTSGSTGEPKGVRISHRSLANLVTAMVEETGLAHTTALLALTSPSFDISVFELCAPLAVGGRLVMAAPADELDPPRLAELITRHSVTAVQATPVTWRQLLPALPPGVRLRQAICGGEPLSGELAGAISRVADGVWNGYGPSETTIYSMCHRADPSDPLEMVPIGRPVANTTARVVDERGRTCPVGVPGELLLGGAGVALGYHRRPELTAERFPARPDGTGRWYRTGDVVRLRYDGRFEFRGRADRQIKLHGHRIELDEVAQVLRGHPDVRDAVVTVRSDANGEDRLVAYVVTDPARPAAAGNPHNPQPGGAGRD